MKIDTDGMIAEQTRDVERILNLLTEARREYVWASTKDRRGGVSSLPFDAELLKRLDGIRAAICDTQGES